jgi:hypothetical protein
MFDYECPSCGANKYSKVGECCDHCIITLFFEQHAPDIDTFLRNFNSIAEWNIHYEQAPDFYKED